MPTLDDIKQSLSQAEPPEGLSAELRALWHDARGDWTAAHEIVQDLETPAAAQVHAYLHRKEGDRSNARYWYHRAHQPEVTGSLDAEWDALVASLLATERS